MIIFKNTFANDGPVLFVLAPLPAALSISDDRPCDDEFGAGNDASSKLPHCYNRNKMS